METPNQLTNNTLNDANQVQENFDFIISEMLGENGSWHLVGDSGEPAFQNSWVNYGSVWQDARFKKVNNVVYIQGLVKDGVITKTIFTLPVGYRPTATIGFCVDTGDANNVRRIDISSTGGVKANSGVNSYGLITLSFRVD